MRNRHTHSTGGFTLILIVALIASFLIGAIGTRSNVIPSMARDVEESPMIHSYEDFVSSIARNHKAPFSSKQLITQQQVAAFTQQHSLFPWQQFTKHPSTNHKVNQDYNPWAKAGAAVAISPKNSHYSTVMTHDFRQNFDHLFYHFTTDGGQHWSDDTLANGYNAHIDAPFDFQSDPGIAIDEHENSFISTLSGNLYFDKASGYINFDTEIEVVQGHSNPASTSGMYTNVIPTTIDYVPCHGVQPHLTCLGQLDKPLITIDNVPTSPARGTIYVYYTYICNSSFTAQSKVQVQVSGESCMDGKIKIPPSSSVILESHASGPGQPFSTPRLVSGSLTQVQFSSMVIDSHGGAHIFFDDFSHQPLIQMYEATLTGNGWTVNMKPVAGFQYFGLQNDRWNFRDSGAIAPGCSIHRDTAFCAFTASQVGSGKMQKTPDVYLATIQATTGSSQVHQINNDPDNNGKDHFFPWATTDSRGKVYVGWYDNRNDPSNANVEYFVGMSNDGGKTFPKQQAVSDVSFNPCNGFPGCFFFGDYYQLVADPDDVIHATWADTRDGTSMQIYTQTLKWE